MLNKRLKEARAELKYSQKYVAEKLYISQQAYAKYETGAAKPNPDMLLRIAELFNVSVDYLVGMTDEKPLSAPVQQIIELNHQNVYMIPVYENAAAGFGALASDEVIDYTPLYIGSPSEATETICIKVTGDSMYPKIENGDIVQVHKQTSVDNGSVAVVLLDGDEGLVKKIYYGADWIELHSFNPMYKTMRFNGRDVERVRVVGLVKKVIKEI